MQYDWDEQKRLSNARKHGIDFQDAVEIFERDTVLMEDDRFDYGERRFVSLGLLQRRVIVRRTHRTGRCDTGHFRSQSYQV